MSEPRYKFVELSVVTEDSLEECVNEWVAQGWKLDAIRFVVGEHSRRPSMAFVSFVRTADDAPAPRRKSRHTEVIELGEIDLGDHPPLDAELDWSQARSRRRAAAPAKGKKKPKKQA